MAEKRLNIYFLSINVKIVKMLKECILPQAQIRAGHTPQGKILRRPTCALGLLRMTGGMETGKSAGCRILKKKNKGQNHELQKSNTILGSGKHKHDSLA